MGMDRTLYFCLSSLERGEDMIFLRMWDGALKCRFRFLLRSEVTKGLNFISAEEESQKPRQPLRDHGRVHFPNR